jgi:eukaryotic-like serine/threonine-protein kinase
VSGPPMVDPERWAKIERLFGEASSLDDEAAVVAFLEESCAGDEELLGEVQALLDATDGADAFLRGMAGRMGLPFGGEQEIVDLVGRTLGAWRLTRRLGQGGMGVVYLAERADGAFEKQVAVKVLPGGTAFGSERERFARERRFLARLEHPGIARLLDGGVSSEGLPFLVMEYVEGEPIDVYCDRNRLSVRERVGLFRKVLEAVEYAHRNLIIHRDLKPANILVAGDGSVKLLDFGIARVVNDEGADADVTALTRWGGRPLTPAFASPEQICGEVLTTASDVYSLGVLLYRLIAGQGPYDVSGLTPGQAERIVCHTDPAAPSGAVAHGAATLNADPEEIARLRRTTVGRLRRTLRGDLDTVVLTALAKEPHRRYASAAALSQDLGRYLAERPVEARRAGMRYRVGKFVRRRPGVTAVALTALIAVVGYGVTLNLHAQRLEVERNSARVEAELRGEVSDFLFGIFRGASPQLGGSEDLTARQLLDRGAVNLAAFDGDPGVAVELSALLGNVYGSIGRYEEAALHMERSLELREEHDLAVPAEVAATLLQLASNYTSLSRFPEAEDAMNRALELRLDEFGDRHELVTDAMNSLGDLFRRQGRLDQAEVVLTEALEMRRELLGPRDLRVSVTLSNLALVQWAGGDPGRAAALLEEAWDILVEHDALDDTGAASTANNLGVLYRQMGRWEESREMYHFALRIRREVLGHRHPAVASTLNNLAAVLYRMGETQAAEEAVREALDQRIEFHGEDDPLVAQSLNSLGNVLWAQEDWSGSAHYLARALAIQEARFGRGSNAVAVTLNNLANALRDGGELWRAESKYLEALAILRTNQGPTHPNVAAVLFQLGLLYRIDGNLAEAERRLTESLEIRRLHFDESHPDLIRTTEELALAQGMGGS